MIKRFLSYTEITTKITSVFAFLITIAYLFSTGQEIFWGRTTIFFVSMFLFDLTTTAINNYEDTKANDQVLQFRRGYALIVIIILFIVSACFGLYLAYITDLLVLFLGLLCFLCGILYSAGPLPISKLPLGEFFSGLFYGFFIPFILLYINMPEGTYLNYDLSLNSIGFSIKIFPMLTVFLLSLPPFCTTANIMLANNICDVKRDIAVKRHTLPYYLGHNALYLFAGLYYLPYLSVIAMIGLKILPITCLAFVLTIIPVQNNIKKFFRKQEKSTTFIIAVKNYLLIMASLCILIFAGGFLKL